MTEQDEIDEQRARIIAADTCDLVDRDMQRQCINRGVCACLRLARAIRLSDEASGYITAKLEGVVNEKDRKG